MRSLRIAVVVLALFTTLLMSCGSEKRETTTHPDAPVIIISVDTLRSDRLPAYGYQGVATPAIDALRKDGILFSSAWSHVPLTLPSHASILTGLLPPQHGVRNNIGYRFDSSQHPTITKVLKGQGYATGAAVSAYVLRSSTGIADDFDFYDDSIASKTGAATGSLQRAGGLTASIANQWISTNAGKPFFFLLHLFEPHSPYQAPEPYRSRYPDSYDAEVAATDAIVGQFIEGLKRDGVYDDALIIFLSDHGEGLGDHGEPEHGIFIYREAIQVPLIVKLPASQRGGESVDRPVGLMDLFPTITELLGLDAPAGLPGESLTSKLPSENRRIYSESLYGRIHLGWSELRGLVDREFHFIQAPRPELYSVTRDPAQKNNVLDEQRRVYASMRDELAQYGSAVEGPSAIDPEDAARLSALGYLGSTSAAADGPLPDPKDRIHEIDAMMKAMRMITTGDTERGIAALRAIVTVNPGFVDAWNQLAVTLETEGRDEEAVAAYRRAIELTPSLAGEFGLALGSLLLKMDDHDGAEAHAKLAEASNPSGTHLLLARVALARGDLARAESEAREAMRDQYEKQRATIVLAQVFIQQGRLAEVLAMLDEVAREANEKSIGPIEMLEFTRGDALARLDREDEAVAAFEREIRDFPLHRRAYANLALVHLVMGDQAGASAVFERMLKASPSRRTAIFAADTLEKLEQPRLAAEWRRRAQTLK